MQMNSLFDRSQRSFSLLSKETFALWFAIKETEFCFKTIEIKIWFIAIPFQIQNFDLLIVYKKSFYR